MKPMPHAPALLRHTQKGAGRTTRRTTTRTKCLLAAALLAACGAPFGDDTATNGPPVEAGVDGGDARDAQDSSVVPPGCDINAEPKDAPNCVVDELGVFLSPTGDDNATGRKDEPVRSFAKALELAQARNLPRLYVCQGNYPEHLLLTRDALLFGNFDCASWKHLPNATTAIAPTDAGYALELRNGANATLADFQLLAKDATDDKPSSVAVFLNQANLTLLRGSVAAGKGKDAKPTLPASNYSADIIAEDVLIAGHDAVLAAGGTTQTCAGLCDNNIKSTGGAGGNGAPTGMDPTAGDAGAPPLGGGAGGSVVVGADCSASLGGLGKSGINAPNALPPTSPGTLSAAGWTPAQGTPAPTGGPGQGGGGGGGANSATKGAGGGGGCGGCGGAGGTPPNGGGASIAIAAFNSSLTLRSAKLAAHNAGHAANGIAGQSGQVGGNGGFHTSGGCPGGAGGKGGDGGASAGGAGGISVGVLFLGDKAKLNVSPDSQISTGTKGNKGTGGKPGAPPSGNDGPDGKSEKILTL